MSLLDQPIKYIGDLLEPLVPLPTDTESVDDIYYCEKVPSTRWRSYIDCENWDPKQYHEDLLGRRAYHARMTYETCLLMATSDINWLCRESIEMLHDMSHLQLRIVEINILSYQLTCGMVGIGSKKRVDLYHCSIFLFMSIKYLSEQLVKNGPTQVRKVSHEKIIGDRPKPSDKKRDLCIMIDIQIYTIQEFLNKGLEFIKKNQTTEFTGILAKKLQVAIIALDRVVIVDKSADL